MKTAFRVACVGVAAVLVAAGCASGAFTGGDDEDTGIECTVDSDCPGGDNVCDLLTNTCTRVSDDDGGTPDSSADGVGDSGFPGFDIGLDGGEDTSEDTGDWWPPEEDSGGADDTGTERDTSMPPQDTWTPPQDTSTPPQDTSTPPQDTGGGTDADTGTPFSGCSTNSDCSGFLVCNQSLGRCEDPRPTCSAPSDCGSNEFCIGGRCVQQCSGTGTCTRRGVNCFEVVRNPSTGACLAACNNFDGSGSLTCNEDRHCVPYFGTNAGLCKGVGRNGAGQKCSVGFGADSCQKGYICANNRGEKRCEPLCGTGGGPSCGSGSYCAKRFILDRYRQRTQNPAGWCRKNCGGLGSTNSGQCGSGEACQPDSATSGYCTSQGSVSSGGSCNNSSGPYCNVGNLCVPSTASNAGMCRTICDPGKSASTNACGSGQACVEQETGYGFCVNICYAPGGRSSRCPSTRPYCLSTTRISGNYTPSSAPGICTVP